MSKRTLDAARSGDARERILATAERMFAENGFDGTSTAKLAAQAGVPQGLVFYYFASKLELLLAIIRERVAPARVAATVPRNGASVRDLLERAIESFADELERNRHIRVILFREAHLHPEIHDRAQQLLTEAAAAIADILAGATDAIDDSTVLLAVAELVVRGLLVDAILLQRGQQRPAHYSVALDVLAAASTCRP